MKKKHIIKSAFEKKVHLGSGISDSQVRTNATHLSYTVQLNSAGRLRMLI